MTRDTNTLSEVRSWMSFWGWTDRGWSSIKLDAGSKVIARFGDATWEADLEKARVMPRSAP